MRPGVVASEIVVTNARGVHSEADCRARDRAAAGAAAAAARRRCGSGARIRGAGAIAAARTALPSASHVVVIGLGSIGERIAAMAAGLGMRVTGVAPPAGAARAARRFCRGRTRSLLEVLPHADAVVLALPRTEETRALIGFEPSST